MKSPPLLLHLKLCKEKGTCGFWLPLFLIYPVLVLCSLALIPFLFFAMLFMWPLGRVKQPLLVLPYAWNLIFQVRGLNFDLNTSKNNVHVDFI